MLVGLAALLLLEGVAFATSHLQKVLTGTSTTTVLHAALMQPEAPLRMLAMFFGSQGQ